MNDHTHALVARLFHDCLNSGLAVAIAVISMVLSGCGATPSIDAPSEFPVPSAAVGETVESKLLIRHHGNSQLSFFRFDIDLSDDYKLDWCTINAQTGEAFGPPRIAGYHNGRVLFPNMLDLLPGQDLLLMMTYTPTNGNAPSGRISMESNDSMNPRLDIVVRPDPIAGG